MDIDACADSDPGYQSAARARHESLDVLTGPRAPTQFRTGGVGLRCSQKGRWVQLVAIDSDQSASFKNGWLSDCTIDV